MEISINKFILRFSLHTEMLFANAGAASYLEGLHNSDCYGGFSYVVNSILAILCLAINKNPNKAKTPRSLFSKLDVTITRPAEALSTGLWNLATLQPVRLIQLQARSLVFGNKHKQEPLTCWLVAPLMNRR